MTEPIVFEGKESEDKSCVARRHYKVGCEGCEFNFDWAICKKNPCIDAEDEDSLKYFIWVKKEKA